MLIYGVALISGCLFIGNFIGEILGTLLGIDSNIGSVGFSMIFLILFTNVNLVKDKLQKPIIVGLKFWQGMYLPVVVAMAASQNVIQAMSGGAIAILTGFITVIVCFLILPILNKLFRITEKDQKLEAVKEWQ